MRPFSLSALALGMATGDVPAAAQPSLPPLGPPVTIPHSEVHTLRSEHVGWDFELWVASAVEGVFPLPSGPRPVLYVLDANLFFGTAVEMSRLMHQLYGELPPLLVVGIAYDTDEPAVQAELRARDFTPTADSGFEHMRSSMPGAREPSLPEGQRLGGAERFLAFLEQEVRPFIESRYEVAEEGSILFGSSLGGLFALYAFLQHPAGFDAYIATSPAIWWGDGVLFEMEEALGDSAEDVEAHLVLAVGSQEESPQIPMLAQFKMVTNVRAMAARLEAREHLSLDLTTLVLEGESHTSVVPVALTRGLRAVYQPSRPPR